MTTEAKFNKAKALVEGGMAMSKAVKKVGISTGTYYNYNKREQTLDQSVEKEVAQLGEETNQWAEDTANMIFGLPVTAKMKLQLIGQIFS